MKSREELLEEIYSHFDLDELGFGDLKSDEIESRRDEIRLAQDDAMESLIIDSIEIGIGYWNDWWPEVKGEKECYSEKVWEAIKRGETLNFGEGEFTGQRGTINLERIARGLDSLMRHNPRVYADIREQNYDSIVADIFFQTCVFGEVIFG